MTVGVAALAGADFSILTLDTGVIEVTGVLHTVASEAGATDDLVTITPRQSNLTETGVNYRPFFILKADVGDEITIVHDQAGAANIYIPGGGDVLMTENNLVLCMYDGTNVHIINAVGQADAFTITNWTENLSLDCDAASNDNLADMVGTIIKILIAAGLWGGSVSA